jgi:energy-converting hydrogenase A subunit R
MNFIFFDLEGPLSPQDNAYELMKLIPNGARIFEVISRYDDLLTLEGRDNYEPGDTLALIVPFLLYHHLPEAKIAGLAERAALVDGAQGLISKLNAKDWRVFCISTSYEQYARSICRRVGIAMENIACTIFPLDQFHSMLKAEDLAIVEAVERDIATLQPTIDDRGIKERLDRFFWTQLAEGSLGTVVRKVKPVGGQRKVEAVEGFASAYNQPLSDVVVVGDSITDFKVLRAVDEAGGLAIAFNANEYALPYATIGLASSDLNDLEPVLKAWEGGRRKAVEVIVRDKERAGGWEDREHFHWLHQRQGFDEALKVHSRIRRLVREEAGGLG